MHIVILSNVSPSMYVARDINENLCVQNVSFFMAGLLLPLLGETPGVGFTI